MNCLHHLMARLAVVEPSRDEIYCARGNLLKDAEGFINFGLGKPAFVYRVYREQRDEGITRPDGLVDFMLPYLPRFKIELIQPWVMATASEHVVQSGRLLTVLSRIADEYFGAHR